VPVERGGDVGGEQLAGVGCAGAGDPDDLEDVVEFGAGDL
jgi:hypothetical protein